VFPKSVIVANSYHTFAHRFTHLGDARSLGRFYDLPGRRQLRGNCRRRKRRNRSVNRFNHFRSRTEGSAVDRKNETEQREENIMIRNTRLGLFGACAIAVLAMVGGLSTPALADSKPAGASPVSGKEVIAIYSGKSWKWSKGGAHFSPNGQFKALWQASVGIGKWSVNTKGTMCYLATWYWEDGGLTQQEKKSCFKHVRTKSGEVWRHFETDGWQRLKIENISSGDKFGSKISRMKKNLGI